MKYTDDYGNVHELQVDRLDAVSNFYASLNVIDCHNWLRQDSLPLEEKWVTQDCFFGLTTTLIGMSIVDSYLFAKQPDIIKGCNSSGLSVQQFTGALAFQLIRKASNLSSAILWAANKKVLKVLVDVNGGTHSLVRYYITMNPSGRKRVNMAFCHLPDRDCFQKHVLMIKRKTRFS